MKPESFIMLDAIMLFPVLPDVELKTDKPTVNLFIKNMVSIRCKMVVK